LSKKQSEEDLGKYSRKSMPLNVRRLHLLALALPLALASTAAHAFFDETRFNERGGLLCEPDLLDRRIAETTGREARFLSAIRSNAVVLYTETGRCSGTFITPTCMLTAAHCFSEERVRVRWAGQPDGYSLENGTGHQYPGYVSSNDGFVRHQDSGDTGVVIFDQPWPAFQPLKVWTFLGNRDFWIHDWGKPDAPGDAAREAALNRRYWSDFGVLGLTAYAPHSAARPDTLTQCTGSHFGWSPVPMHPTDVKASDFAEGRINYGGDTGPGMSGGAVYDQLGILGTIQSSPSGLGGKDFPYVGDTSMQLAKQEFLRPGYGSEFVILLPDQAEWIARMCPGAPLEQRYTLKGARVSDREARDPQGYIGTRKDPWLALPLEQRLRMVSRAMRPGDSGLFVMRLQRRLVETGHFRAKPDGSFGAETEKALRRYQFDNKLKETGIADIWTLERLGILLP
jgi:hypothetical protein